MRYNSLYISSLSSAKQQREMTKCLENVNKDISIFFSIYKSLKFREAICHSPSVGKITYEQNINRSKNKFRHY